VEEDLKKARESGSGDAAETGSVVSAADDKLAEAELLVGDTGLFTFVPYLRGLHNPSDISENFVIRRKMCRKQCDQTSL
jgi:hypothetical protein